MAVTSIWPVKSRLDHVINYARNPAKTRERSLVVQASLHAIDNVIEYAADTIKTEERAYVSCLNCREDDAAAQMMETKRYWGKPDGRLCFHGYQSFAEGEVTAETAHAIGVELAEELWGERFEVVIAMQENHAAREQDKPAVSRPAVKGSVVSKRASAKGKAGKAQRKNASSPKNRGDSNTSRTDSTKDGGGGR